MIFKELFDRVTWEDMWEAMIKLYPDQNELVDGYEDVVSFLKNVAPTENKEGWSIDITHVVDDFKSDPYYPEFLEKFPQYKGKEWPVEEWDDVHGIKPEDAQTYAMELSKLEDWLGWNIVEKTLSDYSEADIVAHCLYEMTFFGCSNAQIQGKKDEIDKSYRECMEKYGKDTQDSKSGRSDEEV